MVILLIEKQRGKKVFIVFTPPEELKGRMKRCKSVNWSEVARKAFEDAARKEEIQCAAEVIKNLRLGSKAVWSRSTKT